MSLSQALSTAITGLRVTQSGMSLVASNIANAESQGYVKKKLSLITTSAAGAAVSVRIGAINRELDLFVQRQLRTESSGGAYADIRAQFYSRLQQVYGQPGTESSLASIFNDFTSAVQNLATSPDSPSSRTAVLSSAQVLAQQLNGMTNAVQALRTDAELGLSAAVEQANQAMAQIARINQQLGTANPADATSAVLIDQRDHYIDQLSGLMDVRVIAGEYNQVTVFTNSGIQLVGTQPSTLLFDAAGTVSASAIWSSDPAERTLGTITLKAPNGGNVDLIANSSFRSGEIAALIEMRDHILPEAQSQLDEIAASLARSMSEQVKAGTIVTSGAQNGFDIDVGLLLNGNNVSLTYTHIPSGTQRQMTIVRVDDPNVLPLPNTTSPNANDQVIGIDFSGGLASVVAQLNIALGSTGMQVSNPVGTTLQFLDDGLSNQVTINAVNTHATVTSLTNGSAEFPFFLDAAKPYSGAITTLGSQDIGFAGRITLNNALVANPSRLVVYQTTPLTPAGDSLRPNFIFNRLTTDMLMFSPKSGVGTVVAPFSGTISSYLRQVLSQQGDAAETAQSLKEGQDIVVNTIQQRLAEQSSVNIDEEMATLLKLQTAYGANARVMTTVKEMLELLMRI